MANCKHTYEVLDIEKKAVKYRYTTDFYRTTRFYCTKCCVIQIKIENENYSIHADDRPAWTYNIKNIVECL